MAKSMPWPSMNQSFDAEKVPESGQLRLFFGLVVDQWFISDLYGHNNWCDIVLEAEGRLQSNDMAVGKNPVPLVNIK